MTTEEQVIGTSDVGSLSSVPDPEPEEAKGTEYIVWKKREPTADGLPQNETWEKIGIGRGSVNNVIKAVAGENPDGIYAASPSRSWRPVRLGVKTEVSLTLV